MSQTFTLPAQASSNLQVNSSTRAPPGLRIREKADAFIFSKAWSNFWDDNETERYAEVDINVNHPIKLTRIAMRALLGKDKKGVVLIVASLAGLQGAYAAALYTATKHAMVGFTRSMGAADHLEGVKIVCICPGYALNCSIYERWRASIADSVCNQTSQDASLDET